MAFDCVLMKEEMEKEERRKKGGNNQETPIEEAYTPAPTVSSLPFSPEKKKEEEKEEDEIRWY